jgi:uncharacterized protein (TIGR03437 family)
MTIYGRLTNNTATAIAPWPTTLGGLTIPFDVGINDPSLRLIYVSPTRVDALVPMGITKSWHILRLGGSLSSVILDVGAMPPALYPSAQHSDGRVVSTSAPADPGESITLYGTGIVSIRTDQLAASVDGQIATITYAGPNPGYEGMDQINIQVPSGVRHGTSVPVTLQIVTLPAPNTSNTVLLAISGTPPPPPPPPQPPVIDSIVPAAGVPPGWPTTKCINSWPVTPICAAPAQGSLITIYGKNLANTTVTANTYPWPTELGGIHVTLDPVVIQEDMLDPGRNKGDFTPHLLFVSPNQINVLLPGETDGGGNSVWPVGARRLKIWDSSGTTLTQAGITVTLQSPALFALANNSAAALHANNQVVSPSYPAAPGEYVALYGTGIAKVADIPVYGGLPPGTRAFDPVTLAVNVDGLPAKISYSGPSQYAGLDQINIQIPNGVHRGKSVPVVISVTGPSGYYTIPAFNGSYYEPSYTGCDCILSPNSNTVLLPIN